MVHHAAASCEMERARSRRRTARRDMREAVWNERQSGRSGRKVQMVSLGSRMLITIISLCLRSSAQWMDIYVRRLALE